MIERTAASLEPCGLQRVLPSSKNALKGHRKLHSTFWQHGAIDIELFDACQTLVRSPLADLAANPLETSQRIKTEMKLGSMTASTFLLDFLYPQGAANFLRRVSPSFLDSRERPSQRLGRLGSRVQATSVSSSTHSAQTASASDDSASWIAAVSSENGRIPHGFRTSFPTPPVEKVQAATPEALLKLLREEDPADKYNRIWYLYSGLSEDLKPQFRTRVLLELSKSTRPMEAWRVADLFSLYRVEEWTEGIAKAAIVAELASNSVKQASHIFETGLETRGFMEGLDALVAYGLRFSDWQLVIDSWQLVLSKSGQRAPLMQEDASDPATTESISSGGKSERDANAGISIGRKLGGSGTDGLSLAVQFERVAELLDFPGRIAQLYSHLETPGVALHPQGIRHQLDSLLALMTRNSLSLFRSPDALFLVDRIGDMYKGYPRLMHLFLNRREKQDAIKLYRKYRQISGGSVSKNLLARLVPAFYPDDIQGMEQLREDWKRAGFKDLSRRTYLKFMSFYARHGDVRTLYEFWNEHRESVGETSTDSPLEKLSKESMVGIMLAQHDPEVLANFLRVHAMHGDVRQVRSILDQALEKHGRRSTTAEQNILLEAHTKVRDYEGALNVFTKICDHGKPDINSFFLVMRLASSLGDLEFTLEMFRLAKEYQLTPNAGVVDTLVEAYCQNERFSDAEILCVRNTEAGELKDKAVMLWNTLLHHHARRRDLTTVNRILGLMSSYKLPFNNETYDKLLTALVNCKQSQHALHLLQFAEKEGSFQPTLYHYILLMTAFIRTGEPHKVLDVHETMMKNKNFPESAERMTKLIAAYGKWKKMPRHKLPENSGQWFVRRALDTFKKSLGREDRTAIDDARSVTRQYSKIISILAEARDFTSAREIIDLYNKQFQKRAQDEKIPIHLLSSMILADYYEQRFDRAKKTWELVMNQLLESGRPASDIFEAKSKAVARDDGTVVDATNAQPHASAQVPTHPSQLPADLATESNLTASEGLSSRLQPVASGQVATPGNSTTVAHKSPSPPTLQTMASTRDGEIAGPGAALPRKSRPMRSRQVSVTDHDHQGTAALLPGVRYHLNEPLSTMQRIYVVERDPAGLQRLVRRVTNAGFEIDNANWNYYVQALARLKRWDVAFETCERKLMPQWEGWQSARQRRASKRQVPLHVRRLGRSPRYLRPIAHTLFILAKEYLDVEKMTPWSVQAGEIFKTINAQCPKVVRAIKSLIRDPESQVEKDIFEGEWDPEAKDLAGEIRSRRPFYQEDMETEHQAHDDAWPKPHSLASNPGGGSPRQPNDDVGNSEEIDAQAGVETASEDTRQTSPNDGAGNTSPLTKEDR